MSAQVANGHDNMQSLSPGVQFWSAVRGISPLAVGVGIYGLAFGLLAAQANMSELQVGIMGATIFAGSSQIIAVERLVAGAGAAVAIVSAIALNLRLVLVTASIRDVFSGLPFWKKALGAHLASDESWAFLLATRAQNRPVGFWFLVGGGTCLLVTWLLATMLGVYFANDIPNPRALGMDFAFTAAFIAIARSLWRGNLDLIPWVASVAVVAFIVTADVVDTSWALIIGGITGALVAALTNNE